MKPQTHPSGRPPNPQKKGAPKFDTMDAMKELTKSGFPPDQAAAIVASVRDAQSELATKSDIEELRKATQSAIEGLRKDMQGMATQSDIEGLRKDMQIYIAELAAQFEKSMNDRLFKAYKVFGISVATGIGILGIYITVITLAPK